MDLGRQYTPGRWFTVYRIFGQVTVSVLRRMFYIDRGSGDGVYIHMQIIMASLNTNTLFPNAANLP